MNKCKNCKAEIDDNKSFCSNRCRQKAYRNRHKNKAEIKTVIIEPVREYSPEYKEQFSVFQATKTLAEQIESKIKDLNYQIESIENRNSTIFGRKGSIIISYGVGAIFSIIASKVLSAVFEVKRKGLLFIGIFAPALIGAYFIGNKLQKIDDLVYSKKAKSLNDLKSQLKDLEIQLIKAKESSEIEKLALETLPKYENLQLQ